MYILAALINIDANMPIRYYDTYPLSICLFCTGGIMGTILMRKIFCIIGQNSISILAWQYLAHWNIAY